MIATDRYILHSGDCLEVMRTLSDGSVDSVITDPPYGLSFMNKNWDHGIPGAPFWAEALRVAKPGAMLLAFGGTRTYHRLVCAIEDAGWEIRDCLMWLYGSGFPKGHDISKAIDRAAGAEREVISECSDNGRKVPKHQNTHAKWEGDATVKVTAPATEAAHTWHGWNVALKPAWEPIVLAMKPLDGTFANNAITHGCAGLNIDGCRVPTSNGEEIGRKNNKGPYESERTWSTSRTGPQDSRGMQNGRWPANLLLDEDAAQMLDEQSGESASPAKPVRQGGHHRHDVGLTGDSRSGYGVGYGDQGGASRFFYVAKASKRERNEGLPDGTENRHPTVKPLELMRYLCRLTKTPTGGVVLDPFCGSGTTGVAALLEGREFIGIELERESFETARCRIEYAAMQPVLWEAAD